MRGRCPECRAVFQFSESMRGKKARCPKCEAEFRVPAAKGGSPAAPGPDRPRRPRPRRPSEDDYDDVDVVEDYDEYDADDDYGDDYGDDFGDYEDNAPNPYRTPARTRKRSRPEGRGDGRGSADLHTTGLGLLCVGYGMITIILAAALLAVFSAGGAGAALAGVAIVVAIIMLCAMLVILVGQFMCLTVPERTGAKGLVIVAICCGALNTLGQIYVRVTETASPLLALVLASLSLTAFVTFQLFLARTAEYVKEYDLASRARVILFGMIGGGAVAILMMVLTLVTQARGVAVISGLIFIPLGIGMIVLGVMQVFLLVRLGNALRA